MTRHVSPRSILSVLACAMLAGGAAACGGADDSSTPAGDAASRQTESGDGAAGPGQAVEAPTRVVGGESVLRVDGTVRRVFDAVGITIEPAGTARAMGDSIVLPVTGGRLDVDTPSGSIRHGGSIRLSAAGRSLTAEQLVVEPGTGAVTAVTAVIDGRRVRFLSADVASVKVPPTSDVFVVPTRVKLAERAVQALNSQLGVEALSGGLNIGRLTINARRP